MEENDQEEKHGRISFISTVALLTFLILGSAWMYDVGKRQEQQVTRKNETATALQNKIIASEGVFLPVVWGTLGKQLTQTGVINADAFRAVYDQRGGFSEEYKNLLLGTNSDRMKVTPKNAQYLLNLFWALGLGNKNEILDTGEMTNKNYGGADHFASTGGWTLAQGNAMDHYSKHAFIKLTREQQNLVNKVSESIYRPCCNNSTHFPDCNHGMAMLGFLELMASQGIGEKEMYKAALQMNTYWFPDTYITIASYLEQKGIPWNTINPKEILGKNFSSGSGYQAILSQIEPVETNSGKSCGV